MDKTVFFWSGWEPILRIVVVGTITYLCIVLLLRVSGKRTLASMNAFDFIITVTMGSAFGRVLTAKGVSVSEAVVTFLLLVSLQYIFSFLEVRSDFFSRLITSQPTLLYHGGSILEKNMRKERIRKEELLGAVRKKGCSGLEEVNTVILEADGSFSVIKKSGDEAKSIQGVTT
ncbi:DUF421 domain-containing protein [Telluribacter humicola]|uniref:DUF421 domain-containing protein n=1 Tax=Telluribacter humicola TaxID=1720261 RepID=UPI001A957561|nr:YetF domain-containing protein [Telluribacter humicola]